MYLDHVYSPLPFSSSQFCSISLSVLNPLSQSSAICINRSEGPSAMFISTSWPMTTLGTSAQKQHNSFHHSEVNFDMAPFPFNLPLIIWWTCETMVSLIFWIHLPGCLDTGLCYPGWFAITLLSVSLPRVFCVLSGDIQR